MHWAAESAPTQHICQQGPNQPRPTTLMGSLYFPLLSSSDGQAANDICEVSDLVTYSTGWLAVIRVSGVLVALL